VFNPGAEAAGRSGYGRQFCLWLSAFNASQDASAPSGTSPSATSSRQSSQRVAGSLSGLRVLVVEDDPDARELVTAILEDAGAVVESAESAAMGFDAVRRFHPQLLVSDIGMPDEDGYSLIRRVRALADDEGGTIPSIALTAYTRREDRDKAIGAGFTLHMGKPVSPLALVTAVRALAAHQS
jgi:CheY-like chemotaxis protein